MISDKYSSELGKLIFIKNVKEYKKILHIEKQKVFSNPIKETEKKEYEEINFTKNKVYNMSYFSHNYSDFPGIFDLNYFYLLSFIDTDFEIIQNLFSKISNQILEDTFSNDYSDLVKELYQNLVKCHPFFMYDAYEFICHTLITNHINQHLKSKNTTVSRELLENMIRKICSSIIDLIPSIPPNSLDDSVECFTTDFYMSYKKIISWTFSEIYSPLTDVINLQEFIIKNIPHVTYDANDKIWNCFLNNLASEFGNIEKSTLHSTVLDDDSVEQMLKRVFKKIDPDWKISYFEPNSWYRIYSFPQYIVTILNTFKNSKCTIQFCYICCKHYITPKKLNKINHDECMKNYPPIILLKKIKASAYNRIYHMSYMLNEEELYKKSGFTAFHSQTFNLVLQHKISPKIYEDYTKLPFYNYNDFQKLKSIIDYANSQKR